MITWAEKNFVEVYTYIEDGKRDKFIVTGVDMFDYGDYPVALCDTLEEVELVVLVRKENRQPGPLGDATWVQRPWSNRRERRI